MENKILEKKDSHLANRTRSRKKHRHTQTIQIGLYLFLDALHCTGAVVFVGIIVEQHHPIFLADAGVDFSLLDL